MARAKQIRRTRTGTLLAAGLFMGGMGCAWTGAEPGPASSASRGLEVGANATLSSVDYVITNAAQMLRQVGFLPVGTSFTLTPTFTALPVGTGYQMNVRGTASDGLTVCTAQTSFDVTAASPPTVSLGLTCSKPPTGTANITAAINVCPTIDALEARPAEARVGGSVVLASAAHDPDQSPNAVLRSRWTVTAGVLQNPTLTGATFICDGPGVATIKWEVTDGDSSEGCPAAATINITCTAP